MRSLIRRYAIAGDLRGGDLNEHHRHVVGERAARTFHLDPGPAAQRQRQLLDLRARRLADPLFVQRSYQQEFLVCS